MKNSSSILTIPDPGIQRLTWSKPPVSVLVIKKVFDETVFEPFRCLLRWLLQEKQMVVYVEESVLKEPQIQDNDDFNHLVNLLHTFKEGEDNLNDMIDFIICLGGDGTLLYASSLFQQSVPPVMAFHLGSLGFLTPFQFDDFRDQVTHVLEGHATLTLRSRLKCIMFKKDSEFINCDHINSIESKGGMKHQHTTVLNEVVIGRGQSAYLCNLDLYVEKRLITSVQGDGLIISTPTGSTAYACAAGASVVHPNVPAIVIVPICPHSLSFRPIVIPAGVEIKVTLSESARNTAWVSYDGRNRQELKKGDCVRITTSLHPVPSISFQDQINDWFNSLAECLHWNVRKNQQGFNSTFSGPHESMLSLDSMSLDSSDNNGHDV
ncbi:NAD kinase-like isoform X2 [Lineus longissimus]